MRIWKVFRSPSMMSMACSRSAAAWFLKVLKGSGMKEDADGYEIRYHEHAPYEVLTTRWLNYGEVLTLKGVEEMVEVYYNSRQFDRTIAHIMEQYDSPYRFFLELAEYYDRKGLSGIGHSRIARYEILRAFLEEKKLSGPDNESVHGAGSVRTGKSEESSGICTGLKSV